MPPPQLPKALWWDHNAHYHDWFVRQAAPAPPGRVLDVGCGRGGLARKLAAHAESVDAIDASAGMIDAARLVPHPDNIHWRHGDILDPELPLELGQYDLVTALCSLHHLPLRPGLARLAALVRPGGTLAVIGVSRPDPVDRALEPLRLGANLVVGLGKAARGRAGKPDDVGMPVRPPVDTLPQIRAAAAAELPGARIRRRLFRRYTLRWPKPAA